MTSNDPIPVSLDKMAPHHPASLHEEALLSVSVHLGHTATALNQWREAEREWERLVQKQTVDEKHAEKWVGWDESRRDTGIAFKYQVLPGILLPPAILPSGKISQSNYNVVVKLFPPICVT